MLHALVHESRARANLRRAAVISKRNERWSTAHSDAQSASRAPSAWRAPPASTRTGPWRTGTACQHWPRSSVPRLGAHGCSSRLPAHAPVRRARVSAARAGGARRGAAVLAHATGRHAFEMPRPGVSAAWAWQRVLEALGAASAVLPGRALLPAFRTAKLRACSAGPSWRCPTRAPRARAGAVGRALLHRLLLLGRVDMLQRSTGVALTRSSSLD